MSIRMRILDIQDKANELCATFEDLETPVLRALDGNKIETSPISKTDSSFSQCVKILPNTMKAHVSKGLPLLTSPQFILLDQHLKQRGFSLVLIPPELSGAYASLNMAVLGKTVLLNPKAPGFALDLNLLFIADHEIAHQTDIQEMKQAFPDIQHLFNNARLSREAMITKLNAYLDYFGRDLVTDDKEDYEALRREFFGNFKCFSEDDLIHIGLIFYETLRYAYENQDPRLKTYVFSKDFLSFKEGKSMGKVEVTSASGERVDLKKAVIKARLIEAELWEGFTQLNDFDNNKANEVNGDLVLFFRLAIMGTLWAKM